MYTRRHSRGRLGRFDVEDLVEEGLGASTLGQQAPASSEVIVTAPVTGAAGGFLNLIKNLAPAAGAIYSQDQQMKHNQWLVKQGLAPLPLTSAGAGPSYRPVATGGSNLPLIIGLGAAAAVAFMMFGPKKK